MVSDQSKPRSLTCAKFSWNECSNFDTAQVLIFCDLGSKTPIHEPMGFGRI